MGTRRVIQTHDDTERTVVHVPPGQTINPERLGELESRGWRLARVVQCAWHGASRGLIYHYERPRTAHQRRKG
jgi:hypothetical protein